LILRIFCDLKTLLHGKVLRFLYYELVFLCLKVIFEICQEFFLCMNLHKTYSRCKRFGNTFERHAFSPLWNISLSGSEEDTKTPLFDNITEKGAQIDHMEVRNAHVQKNHARRKRRGHRRRATAIR